jgi:glucose/mannose transport system substrate-binding protein
MAGRCSAPRCLGATGGSPESRAIAVFAHEYKKRGGKWIDDPAVGPQAETALAMNRIAGGNPPTAMLAARQSRVHA